ncbi:MAG: abortive phage infection protein [Tenericutes bacterium GWC2_34_14]|nr:MAG: abortive phage infection protein [Tenericutes bacterium GWA2_35_7]OHE28529.1 MAG: abortive phage infection protein [Tenericutes bacterium GWC2_34_14]OHE33563.1 MAG: abortive phage infection protein [Tenericutes bacterium GWE2_34_108]OHE36848.1 MAG: abortive phage infection protein [Tenericutes bacterium GWF1_35_14]OHE38072.1 MAG: abortive phage infection protein [Tenericutes bacterium GWF2_35_184]OHE42095.1 MAG: abortive phage infection protein [Tenericutes bacterium RIFOXYA12_FULL_35_
MSRDKLLKLIKDNNGYVQTKDLEKYGIHREYLSIFVEEEKLIRVSNGIYQSPDVWSDPYLFLQSKRKNMIFSHDTALYLHGLTDRDPIKLTATVPTGYNTTQMKSISLDLYTIKKELFHLGETRMKSPYGNDITVYDRERTLCDMIRSRSKLDQHMIVEGLKQYIRLDDRDIHTLMSYAKELRVDKILRNMLELLL